MGLGERLIKVNREAESEGYVTGQVGEIKGTKVGTRWSVELTVEILKKGKTTISIKRTGDNEDGDVKCCESNELPFSQSYPMMSWDSTIINWQSPNENWLELAKEKKAGVQLRIWTSEDEYKAIVSRVRWGNECLIWDAPTVGGRESIALCRKMRR